MVQSTRWCQKILTVGVVAIICQRRVLEKAKARWHAQASRTHELRKSGELVATEGLALPDRARLVRADKDGAPITDGVFPESKEFLASYSIIDVESPERAGMRAHGLLRPAYARSQRATPSSSSALEKGEATQA